MKPNDRLAEIEKYYAERINPSHPKKNVTWLIARVKKLTEALDSIAYPGAPTVYEARIIARKALEGDE